MALNASVNKKIWLECGSFQTMTVCVCVCVFEYSYANSDSWEQCDDDDLVDLIDPIDPPRSVLIADRLSISAQTGSTRCDRLMISLHLFANQQAISMAVSNGRGLCRQRAPRWTWNRAV